MIFPLRVKQPLHSKTISTFSVIAIYVVVFLYQHQLGPHDRFAFFSHWGVATSNFRLATVFSSMFIHPDWLTIILDLPLLWCFGRSLEDVMGSAKFLIFYLLCGTVSAFTLCGAVLVGFNGQGVLFCPDGATLGVAAAYVRKFPRTPISALIFLVFFVTTVEMPAVFLLGFWFLIYLVIWLDLWPTACLPLIGGFLAGLFLVGVVGTQKRAA